MGVLVSVAGLATTVQDQGRSGLLGSGFPPSGAMDARAARLANALVGNGPQSAVLEWCLAGPTLEFEEDRVVALAGADCAAALDGEPVPRYRALAVRGGQRLELGAATRGVWGYVAFAGGGLATPVALGSRSAYPRAGLEGVCGRTLRDGDELPLLANGRLPAPTGPGRRVDGEDLYYGFDAEAIWLRAIPGPQCARLSEAGARTFWGEAFEVTGRSDRMGYRLAGPAVGLAAGADVVSAPLPLGAVQVPESGEPIVMCADHQTCGGYVTPATVARCDLPLLVQRRPGQRVRLSRSRVEDAQRALWRDERHFGHVGRREARDA